MCFQIFIVSFLIILSSNLCTDRNNKINILTLLLQLFMLFNGTTLFKNINHCLNTNIYSYLETSGGQSSNPYLNVAHFFNTKVD